MRDPSRFIWGVLLIVLGVGFLLEQMGVFSGFWSLVGYMWPLIFLFFAIISISNKNYSATLIFGLMWMVFQLSAIVGWDIWAMLWPLFIIGAGVLVLIRMYTGEHNKSTKEGNNTFSAMAIFGEAVQKVTGDAFSHGSISAIFGSSTIDLRNASLAKNGGVIDVFAAFGGVEIVVPKSMRVDSAGTPVLGSWKNTFVSETKANGPVLKIRGTVVLGGVEVKN